MYHPKSDHARMAEEYATDFERIKGRKIELISLESHGGAAAAKLYDVLQYPAIVATRDDGQLLKSWQGDLFPLMDEVAAYSGQ